MHCTSFSSGRATWRIMVCVVHIPQLLAASAFCVRFCCPSVSIWTNFRTCGCLLAPQGGITLTTRAIRSQIYILSNSYKLVRAPRLLCRCRLPHGSHMVQRLQALCPAHRLHTVPSVHRFRRAPPALSQVTLCQPCLLRLPRISVPPPQLPVPHPTSGCRHADFSTHRCLSGRFKRNSRSRSSWLHLLRTMFSAPRVPDPSLRHFLTRADAFVQRRISRCLHTITARGVLHRVEPLQ